VLLHIYPAASLRLHSRYLWLTLERLFGEKGRSVDVNGMQYNDGLAVRKVEQRGPGRTPSPLVQLPWLPFPEAMAGKPESPD
jgi:hypothetical protein